MKIILGSASKQRNIFSQAGAFSLEDPLIAPFIERIEGTVDSIEGLPIEILERLMKEVVKYEEVSL